MLYNYNPRIFSHSFIYNPRIFVQLQSSNYNPHRKISFAFFHIFIHLLEGELDVKWFDTAKVCQFRFNDLFHVVRSRCWFYSLPLFCVGSPP